jgi:DNA-binding transcriptional regulator YiaG
LDGSLHRGCGGRYALHTENVTMRFSGMATEVARQFFQCDKCGHESRTIDQREAAEKMAIDQIRAANGLMPPRGIRQLREGFGLTVAQFSELCYGTPRGIVEGWEKGRYLQNREADALMRSFTDRETLERRAAKAGVVLPELPAVPGSHTPAAAPASDPLSDATLAHSAPE